MSTKLGDEYVALLRAIHRADLVSRRAADLQLGEQIGIGRAMFLILDLIADEAGRPLSQQSIADQLGLTRAAVSRHVRMAHENGWLVADRSTASLRENSITLTGPGRDIVERGRRHRDDAGRQATAVLGRTEMRRTTADLDRLSVLLEERANARADRKPIGGS